MPRHTPIYSRLQQQARMLHNTNTGEVMRRPGRVLRWIVILALLAVLFFGIQNAYSALAASDLFRLEQISVVGNGLLTPREVVACSGLQVGGNLFETDLAAATRRLAAHPLVRNTLLLRQPPATLVISLEERRPIALVTTAGGLVGLDREGTLFALPQVGLNLPVVTGIKAVQDSTGALMGLVHFLEALQADAPEFLAGVSEVHLVSPEEARVFLAGSGLEVRMRLGAPVLQARNFEAYLAAGAHRADAPAYVDLRFKDQVVVGRM